jgi:hypothetical protein
MAITPTSRCRMRSRRCSRRTDPGDPGSGAYSSAAIVSMNTCGASRPDARDAVQPYAVAAGGHDFPDGNSASIRARLVVMFLAAELQRPAGRGHLRNRFVKEDGV